MHQQVPEQALVRLGVLGRDGYFSEAHFQLRLQHHPLQRVLAAASQPLHAFDRVLEQVQYGEPGSLAHQRWLAQPGLDVLAGEQGRLLGRVDAQGDQGQTAGSEHYFVGVFDQSLVAGAEHTARCLDALQQRLSVLLGLQLDLLQVNVAVFALNLRLALQLGLQTLHVILVLELGLLFHGFLAHRLLLGHRLFLPAQQLVLEPRLLRHLVLVALARQLVLVTCSFLVVPGLFVEQLAPLFGQLLRRFGLQLFLIGLHFFDLLLVFHLLGPFLFAGQV
ncbi:Zinc transporter [Brachionus plicatilis]|uniref:Zinc transporter n=1 Tax=Brachionus plicatilis TaxID=10195 RepID=A0A3M7Q3F5_BRAPC|nr:Zinc transporter [Brachionus plicatilis]